MKVLFAARMARFDLLRATQGLEGRVTMWPPECDKSLHRLMCYIHSTMDRTMIGFVGDPPDKSKTWLFADSDHAGEHDSRSTSGCLLALVGPNTFYPIHSQPSQRSRLQRLCHRQRLTSLRRTLLWVLLDCLPPACGQSSVKRGERAPIKAKTPGGNSETRAKNPKDDYWEHVPFTNEVTSCITQLIRIVQ